MKMPSAEQSLLLSVLRDYINGVRTVLPGGAGTAELAALSKRQQTDAIVSFQTHIPELSSSVPFASYCAVTRRNILEKIRGAFGAGGIRYLVFKGSELAGYYPHPQLRQSGDIDILVGAENLAAAGEALLQLGFEAAGGEKEEHEKIYIRGDMEIELHSRLLYEGHLNGDNFTAFTDRAWEFADSSDGVRYHLDPSFQLVFLILHMRKHFLWAGLPVRQFLDLAFIVKNCPDIDWKRTEDYIAGLGLSGFAGTCFELTERWFGIASPVKTAGLTDAFCESASEAVLGFDALLFAEKNRAEMTDNEVIGTVKHRKAGFFGRIGMTLSVIFPPYSEMKRKYPGMGRCPLFLPVMWIRRMCGSLARGNASERTAYALKPVTLGKKTKERAEYLRQWGL